jgi:hypothetical protein
MLHVIPRIILIKTLLLGNFPSGSSISYHDERFYLVGDDAGNIAVLDHHYRAVDSIRLFDYPEQRIPKAQKTDFETAVIIQMQDKAHLLALGSASRKEREKAMLIPLPAPDAAPATFDMGVFTERLRNSGIPEINIEGAAVLGKLLLLANRGNNAHPQNQLVITEKDYWARQGEARISVLPLALSAQDGFKGISELCYVPSGDRLLFTFSSEATSNAYDDGVIGDSYIGWVNKISQKLQGPELQLDGIINLSEADAAFKGEKIEGICVEQAGDRELLLHLVADNDKGQSRLFNVRMLLD